jgi:hypothetical protein
MSHVFMHARHAVFGLILTDPSHLHTSDLVKEEGGAQEIVTRGRMSGFCV